MRKEQTIDVLKVGDTLMFTGETTLGSNNTSKWSKNIIRHRYYEEAGLEPGTRCQITALGKWHVNLHCPNGQHDFGTNAISEDFVRCPREAAFEKLGI